MKKKILFYIALCSILNLTGFKSYSQKRTWQTWKTWNDIPAFIKKGLSSEKATWKFGFQAAKKKLWFKQQLSRDEQKYYKRFLIRVGGVAAAAAILTILGGIYIQQKKATKVVPLTPEEQATVKK